jgi:DNA polymerase-3 subunit beta
LEFSLLDQITTKNGADGVAVVSARLITEIVKSLPPGNVTIKSSGQDDKNLEISSGNNQFRLNVMSPDDFPAFPEVESQVEIELEGRNLLKALRQVKKSISKDETRPVLNGGLLEVKGQKLRLVATDSYRLSLADIEVRKATEATAIIPGKVLEEIERIIPTGREKVVLLLSNSQAMVKAGKVTLVTRLVEGNFPKYERIIPEKFSTEVELDKQELESLLARAIIVAEKNMVVNVGVSSKKVTVFARSEGIGELAGEIVARGEVKEKLNIAFNVRYFLDGVSSLSGETVSLAINSNSAPVMISSPGKDRFKYIVMPVKTGIQTGAS